VFDGITSPDADEILAPRCAIVLAPKEGFRNVI
jgi:hypothetical protein